MMCGVHLTPLQGSTSELIAQNFLHLLRRNGHAKKVVYFTCQFWDESSNFLEMPVSVHQLQEELRGSPAAHASSILGHSNSMQQQGSPNQVSHESFFMQLSSFLLVNLVSIQFGQAKLGSTFIFGPSFRQCLFQGASFPSTPRYPPLSRSFCCRSFPN